MKNISRQSRLALASLLLTASACSLDSPVDIPPPIALEDQVWAPALGLDLSAMTRLQSGVYYLDIEVGDGETITTGQEVEFFYTGYLASGFVFESNVGGVPARLEVADLIPGLIDGLAGMQVGGTRRIVVPSHLAYGEGSSSVIPANANLVFDIELVSII